jgi:hypothetical protein
MSFDACVGASGTLGGSKGKYYASGASKGKWLYLNDD